MSDGRRIDAVTHEEMRRAAVVDDWIRAESAAIRLAHTEAEGGVIKSTDFISRVSKESGVDEDTARIVKCELESRGVIVGVLGVGVRIKGGEQ